MREIMHIARIREVGVALCGACLRAARKRRGLSQRQAAVELGVTQPTVARWERGEIGIHPLREAALWAWIEESRYD